MEQYGDAIVFTLVGKTETPPNAPSIDGDLVRNELCVWRRSYWLERGDFIRLSVDDFVNALAESSVPHFASPTSRRDPDGRIGVSLSLLFIIFVVITDHVL